MNFDEFEKRLKKQTFRAIPSEWRKEILKAVTIGESTEIGGLRTKPSFWRQWLWPSPIAWGGVAAAWIVIIALNMATPRPDGLSNIDLATFQKEALRFLVAQRQVLEMENGM